MTTVPSAPWPVLATYAGIAWPPAHDADIERLYACAQQQKLLPLLLDDPALPPAVAAAKLRYRALQALHRRRYELARAGIRELLRVLGPDAVLLYKGADYCHRLYPRPELRPMRDVDVLVPAAAFDRVIAALAAAGHPRAYCDFGAAFAPGHHEVSVPVRDVHVEVHRSFGQRIRCGIDYAGIWRRRERFEADGIVGCRMDAADALLCHAYNLAIDEFGSELVHYVDFERLLAQYADRLDVCVQRAREWSIERALFGALHVTTTLLPNAATPAVLAAMERLLDARTRRFLVERVLPDRRVESSGHPRGRMQQLWRKFCLMDRRWRRAAFVPHVAFAGVRGWLEERRVRRSGVALPARRAR